MSVRTPSWGRATSASRGDLQRRRRESFGAPQARAPITAASLGGNSGPILSWRGSVGRDASEPVADWPRSSAIALIQPVVAIGFRRARNRFAPRAFPSLEVAGVVQTNERSANRVRLQSAREARLTKTAPRAIDHSRMLFVFRGAIAGGLRVCFAHVRALLCRSVIVSPGEMVDARLRIDPDDGVGRAMRLCLGV